MTLLVRFVSSISALDRDGWDACFPGELEDYNYHLAVEHAKLADFEFGWYVAERNRRLVAAIPVFFMTYDLATTAQGRTRNVLLRMQPWTPGQLRLKLSCLGSPTTESCPVGVHPELTPREQADMIRELCVYWVRHAAQRNIGLLGVKDLADEHRLKFGHVFHGLGFQDAGSLPIARLDITFADMEAYLSNLGKATRKDLRRKLKARPAIEVEWRRDVGDHLDAVMKMYAQTRARSPWAFEDLTPAYFEEVLSRMPERALLALYSQAGRTVAANLVLVDDHRMIDKYFFMDEDDGRRLNLYFLSWIENVQMCVSRRLASYQSGQAAHETKVRLGSQLTKSWIFFRHRNWTLNMMLRLAAPLLALSEASASAPLQ